MAQSLQSNITANEVNNSTVDMAFQTSARSRAPNEKLILGRHCPPKSAPNRQNVINPCEILEETALDVSCGSLSPARHSHCRDFYSCARRLHS